jgi:hypothetical protein
MIAKGYASEMETGRQFFYSPEYNAAIGIWQQIAKINPITEYLVGKPVSLANLLGKYYFANSLDEQQLAIATNIGEQLPGGGQFLEGFNIGWDLGQWGTDPAPLRQELYN